MVSKLIKYPLIFAGALAVNIALVSEAFATKIFLGTGSGYNVAKSFTYDTGKFTLTATGFGTNYQGKVGERSVYRDTWGLGVYGGWLDDPQIDGLGPDDTLVLDFSKRIKLVTAIFSEVDSNDDVKIEIDSSQVFSGDIPNIGYGLGKVSFLDAPLGTKIEFSALDKWDNYLLKAVEVKHVPEPTTILATLAASGGAFLMNRKRKRLSDSKKQTA